MSEKMFSREQYEQLRSFPEISRDELFRYFTLTPADAGFVDPGAGRGPADRLGIGGAGNNRAVSTATASSFLNSPWCALWHGVVVSVAGTDCRGSRAVG